MERNHFILLGIGIAIFIGILAVFLASGDPDGLESTALVVQGDKTLTGATPENAEIKEDLTGKFSYESPFPDYTMGDALGKPGELIVMIVGIILAFVAVFGVSKLMTQARKREA